MSCSNDGHAPAGWLAGDRVWVRHLAPNATAAGQDGAHSDNVDMDEAALGGTAPGNSALSRPFPPLNLPPPLAAPSPGRQTNLPSNKQQTGQVNVPTFFGSKIVGRL